MWNLIDCSGHPRDLGFDQGLALRSVIRERVAAAGLPLRRSRWPRLSAFASGRVRGRGPAREMIRHFTHLAERADGLARGADVPLDSLLRLLERPETDKVPTLGASIGNFQGTHGAGILQTLPGLHSLLRRSRPEVGFASVEVSAAWHVSALAGINEAGLAISWVPASPEPGSPAPVQDVRSSPLPPAGLLVQDCLQRFEDVEAAIGWSMNRPAAGEATILMADASGSRAAVRFARAGRNVEREEADVLVAGAPEAELGALKAWALAENDTGPESAALEDAVAGPQIRLVCSTRQLELLEAGGRERIISVVAE